MKKMVLTVAIVLLAGCSSPTTRELASETKTDTGHDTPLMPANFSAPWSLPWSLPNCSYHAMMSVVQRAPIAGVVPKDYTVQGSSTTSLFMAFMECDSLAASNGDLAKGIHAVAIYVLVDPPKGSPEGTTAYLLALVSDAKDAMAQMAALGYPASMGVVDVTTTAVGVSTATIESGTLSMHANGAGYMSNTAGNLPDTTFVFYNGPLASCHCLTLEDHNNATSQLVFPMSAQTGGLLADWAGPTLNGLMDERQTTMRFSTFVTKM